MTDHLTGAQIRAVVEEIRALETHAFDTLHWRIEEVNHLYFLPVEAYLVRFHNDATYLYVRENGRLEQASGWSYQASDNFEDLHKPYHELGLEATAESGATCAVCGLAAPQSNRCPGCRAFFCDSHYQPHLDDNAQFLKSIGAEGGHA